MALYIDVIVIEIIIYIHVRTHIHAHIYIDMCIYIYGFTILPSFYSQNRVEDTTFSVFSRTRNIFLPLDQFLGINVKETLLKFLRNTFITLSIIDKGI